MNCKLVFFLACVALATGLPAEEKTSDVKVAKVGEQVQVVGRSEDLIIPTSGVASSHLAFNAESAGEEPSLVREKRKARRCYNYPKRDRWGRVTLKRICH